ncbi:hypothetical protein TFLX_00179 [Thermoflexales bacterium]|nr:hypothetical protein TFLX_00179 [Thermoflexales bacterium]
MESKLHDVPNRVFVLSVYSSETAFIDLKDLLAALEQETITQLFWGIGWLDWLGEVDAINFNNELDRSRVRRVIISGARLMELSRQVWQTLEGVFVGYFSEVDATEFMHTNWSLTRFANSSAQVAIEAIDGSYFDVYLRSSAMMDHLAQVFKRVQRQDPANFLERYDSSGDGTNPT